MPETTQPNVLTDDDADTLVDNFEGLSAEQKPWALGKLREYHEWRSHNPKPVTPEQERADQNNERTAIGYFQDFDKTVAKRAGNMPSFKKYYDGLPEPDRQSVRVAKANEYFAATVLRKQVADVEGDNWMSTRASIANQLFLGVGRDDNNAFYQEAASYLKRKREERLGVNGPTEGDDDIPADVAKSLKENALNNRAYHSAIEEETFDQPADEMPYEKPDFSKMDVSAQNQREPIVGKIPLTQFKAPLDKYRDYHRWRKEFKDGDPMREDDYIARWDHFYEQGKNDKRIAIGTARMIYPELKRGGDGGTALNKLNPFDSDGGIDLAKLLPFFKGLTPEQKAMTMAHVGVMKREDKSGSRAGMIKMFSAGQEVDEEALGRGLIGLQEHAQKQEQDKIPSAIKNLAKGRLGDNAGLIDVKPTERKKVKLTVKQADDLNAQAFAQNSQPGEGKSIVDDLGWFKQGIVAMGRTQENMWFNFFEGAAKSGYGSLKFKEGQEVDADAAEQGAQGIVERARDNKALEGFQKESILDFEPIPKPKVKLTKEQADEANTILDQKLSDFETLYELREIAQGKLNPISKDSIPSKAWIGLMESIPAMAYTMTPFGAPVRFMAYRYDAENKLIRQDIPRKDAAAMAPWIGALQAGLDHTGLLFLKKVPYVEEIFNRYLSSTAAKTLGRFTVTTAAETVNELGQDILAEAVVTDVYAAITKRIPGTKWEIIREEMGKQAPETVVAMLLLSAVGVGSAHIKDLRGVEYLVGNERALQLLGFDPEAIKRIQRAALVRDPEFRLLGSTFGDEWVKRTPEATWDKWGFSQSEAAAAAQKELDKRALPLPKGFEEEGTTETPTEAPPATEGEVTPEAPPEAPTDESPGTDPFGIMGSESRSSGESEGPIKLPAPTYEDYVPAEKAANDGAGVIRIYRGEEGLWKLDVKDDKTGETQTYTAGRGPDSAMAMRDQLGVVRMVERMNETLAENTETTKSLEAQIKKAEEASLREEAQGPAVTAEPVEKKEIITAEELVELEQAPPGNNAPGWIQQVRDEVMARTPQPVRDKVATLAAERKTSRQIAKESGLEENDVVAIKSAMGIPSWTTATTRAGNAVENPEFTQWVKEYRDAKAAPAGKEAEAAPPEIGELIAAAGERKEGVEFQSVIGKDVVTETRSEKSAEKEVLDRARIIEQLKSLIDCLKGKGIKK